MTPWDRSVSFGAVLLLTLGIVTHATGDVQLFDNRDGTFAWNQQFIIRDPLAIDAGVGFRQWQALRVTQPATQDGIPDPFNFDDQFYLQYATNVIPIQNPPASLYTARVIAAAANMDLPLDRIVNVEDIGAGFAVPKVLASGDTVDGTLDWIAQGPTMTLIMSSDVSKELPYAVFIPDVSYLPLRFMLPDKQPRFGWVELSAIYVEVPGEEDPLLFRFTATRWAYETTPNTPIVITPPSEVLGDLNCDDQVTVTDINGFVLALTDPDAFANEITDCTRRLADMNQDGAVSVSDINGFVTALVSGR